MDQAKVGPAPEELETWVHRMRVMEKDLVMVGVKERQEGGL